MPKFTPLESVPDDAVLVAPSEVTSRLWKAYEATMIVYKDTFRDIIKTNMDRRRELVEAAVAAGKRKMPTRPYDKAGVVDKLLEIVLPAVRAGMRQPCYVRVDGKKASSTYTLDSFVGYTCNNWMTSDFKEWVMREFPTPDSARRCFPRGKHVLQPLEAQSIEILLQGLHGLRNSGANTGSGSNGSNGSNGTGQSPGGSLLQPPHQGAAAPGTAGDENSGLAALGIPQSPRGARKAGQLGLSAAEELLHLGLRTAASGEPQRKRARQEKPQKSDGNRDRLSELIAAQVGSTLDNLAKAAASQRVSELDAAGVQPAARGACANAGLYRAQTLPVARARAQSLARAARLADELVAGTREWALERVLDWTTDTCWVRVLAVIGPAGSGKSVLAGEVCARGGLVSKPRIGESSYTPAYTHGVKVLAAHLFGGMCDEGPITVLFSIAQQLSDALPRVAERFEGLDRSVLVGMDLEDAFRRVIAEPLRGVLRQRAIVVVDGLDGQPELATLLARVWHDEVPEWLGLLVTARSKDCLTAGKHGATWLDLQPEQLSQEEDVKLALRGWLARAAARQSSLCGPEVRDPIDALAVRAAGSMLRARLLCSLLTTEHAAGREIDATTLAMSVEGAVLEALVARLMRAFGDGWEPLISCLLAARGSVPTAALAEAAKLSEARLLEIAAEMEGVLRVTTEDAKARRQSMAWSHPSLAEWLIEHGEQRFGVRVVAGDTLLADWCVANADDDFALQHALHHLRRLGRGEDAARLVLRVGWVLNVLRGGTEASALASEADAALRGCTGSVDAQRALEVARVVADARGPLAAQPDELVGQLLARLPEGHPSRNNIALPWPWLRPLWNSLRAVPAGEGHRDAIACVATVANGLLVVTGGRDGKLCVWSLATGALLRTLVGHLQPIVSLSTSGWRICSSSSDGHALLWSVEQGSLHVKLDASLSWERRVISCVALSDSLVAAGCCDTVVRIYALPGAEVTAELRGHTGAVTCVDVSGTVVASGSRDCTVRLWTGSQCARVLSGPGDCVTSVAVLGDTVVAGAVDRAVYVWATGLPSAGSSSAPSRVLLSQSPGRVLLGHSDAIVRVSLSGQTIASEDCGGEVRYWHSGSLTSQQLLDAARPLPLSAIKGPHVSFPGGAVGFTAETRVSRLLACGPAVLATSGPRLHVLVLESSPAPLRTLLETAVRTLITTSQH